MAALRVLRTAPLSNGSSSSAALLLRSFASSAPAFESESDNASTKSAHPVPVTKAAEQQLTERRAPGDIVPAGISSGAPDELHHRPVRIYRPAPPVTQSAKTNSHHWRIDWDILPGSNRWENPLMGWASSGDYMQGTHIKFRTKDDAILFAEKQGWEYTIQEPQPSKFKPKSYAANYLHSAGKLRQVQTK